MAATRARVIGDPMMNSEAKLLRWVLAAIAVSVLATTFGMYWRGAEALEGQRRVGQHQQTLQLLDSLMLSVTELEAGQRGYLLTGREDSLVPYTAVKRKLGSQLEQLSEHANSGRLPQAQVRALSLLLEEKASELAQLVALHKNSGAAAANKMLLNGERDMEAIRKRIADLRALEANHIESGLKDLGARTTTCTFVLVIGAILNLALITWAYHRLHLERQARVEAMRNVDVQSRLWTTVLASIGDAILIADRESRISFMNDEAERLTGWKLQEAKGQPLEQVFHTLDERSRRREPLSLSAEKRGSRDYLIVTKTGEESPVAITVAPLEGGAAGGEVVVSFRDMTGPRLADTWLRTIFDSTYDAILIHDENGQVLDFNEKALELYGVSPKDFEFLTIFDLSTPGTSHQEAKGMWARVMAGERRLFEWKAIRPFERKGFEVEVFLKKVHFPGREAIMANIRDITQRKEAERELRDRESQLRTIFESLPQLVWTATGENGCDYVNGQWVTYTGAPETEVLGFGWIKFIHPDDAETARETWQRAVERSEAFTMEYRLLGRDKNYREFMVRAAPVKDAEGKVTKWFGTCTDIAELAKARQTLAQSRVELEATVQERTARLRETVAELEGFTYSLSHDMRAPLRTMRSFAQILKADYGERLDDEAREHLTRIETAAGRLDQLIQDMLGYSRILSEEPELEQVDCDKLVKAIIAERPCLQAPNAIVEIVAPLPWVRAHPATLRQCIFNILDNAAKFIKPGGACKIVVSSERLQTGVRLWIEDDGIGIPAEYTSRIFGVFQRLHREDEYPGTGIGLAIVRKAVERMGGKVGVESQTGRGSRFWLELPGAEEEQHEAEQHSTY